MGNRIDAGPKLIRNVQVRAGMKDDLENPVVGFYEGTFFLLWNLAPKSIWILEQTASSPKCLITIDVTYEK